MKKIFFALIATVALWSCTDNTGIIEVEVPVRPAGQEHVLGLTTEPLDTVRVGFVGLGMRGPGAVYRFTHIPGVKIVALCDVEADRVAAAQNILTDAGLPEAAAYRLRIYRYRLGSPCPCCPLCDGTWKACCHRGSCGYDS